MSIYGTVIARFRGQFGNQLFQAAAAIALAKENRCDVYFPDFDNLNAPHLQEMNLEKNYRILFHRIHNTVFRPYPSVVYREPDFNYHPIPYYRNIEIVGFFLSEKFFKKYKDVILELYSAPREVEDHLQMHFASLLDHPKTVGVHVRTGYPDYKKSGFSPQFYQVYLPPDAEYFKKAIHMFESDCLFVVFSDHIGWCKEQFKGIDRNLIFIEGQDYIHDFYLLTKCKHAIIANSSFSWWAAYLNRNPDKKIICRRPFIAPYDPLSHPKDIICEDWYPIDMHQVPGMPIFP
ncbi:MAG TPA: alpha-1,2-fucosyltransferase [Rhabdochlamydiaceae bacterium]|nr:alpha-1,2-fucosyltransferase [Rhabdochlamydiaceae bacterium]